MKVYQGGLFLVSYWKNLSSEQDFYSWLRIVHHLTPEDSFFVDPKAAGVVENPQRKPFVVFQFEVNSAVGVRGARREHNQGKDDWNHIFFSNLSKETQNDLDLPPTQ